MGFSYNVNVLNQKGSPALYTDTFANRPPFGYAGRLFIANDTSAIYEDTGTAWVLIANVSSGAGTLQQVTTNGNTSNVGISITAGGLSTDSLTDTALTLGSVLFSGAAGLVTQDNAAFFWDDTNNRLGINTTTPTNTLDLHFAGTGAMLGLNNTAGNQSAIVFANTGTNKWRIGNSATNSFDIFNNALGSNAISISTASNSVSFLASIKIQQGAGFAGVAGYNGIGCDAGGFFFELGTSTNNPYFNFIGLTGARTYTYPDASGTLALTSNLSAYLPLAGGTLTGTLITQANGNTFGLAASTGRALILQAGSTDLSIQFKNSAGGDGNLTTSGTSTTLNYNFATYSSANALYIANNGNVGIGNATPSASLDVVGDAKISGKVGIGIAALQPLHVYATSTTTSSLFETNAANSYIGIKSTSGTNYIGNVAYDMTFEAGGSEKMRISSAGVVTLTNLAGTGSRAVLASSTGVLSAPVSDISVKQNIEPLKYGLNTVMQLNAVQFEFIEEYKNYGEGLQIGAIAQEVEQIIPEAVFKTPSTGLKGINYDQFNGIYIKAIQDLNNIIDGLLKRIELLENK